MSFPKTVSVSWSDPNPAGSVTDYIVKRNGQTVTTLPVPATSFTEQVAGPGTYQYDVIAKNAQDQADPSSGALILLAPVSSLTVTVSA